MQMKVADLFATGLFCVKTENTLDVFVEVVRDITLEDIF